MDVQTITTLVGTLGFPIVACGALFYLMMKQDERNHEEMNSLKDALSKLEIAIVKLCEKLDFKE